MFWQMNARALHREWGSWSKVAMGRGVRQHCRRKWNCEALDIAMETIKVEFFPSEYARNDARSDWLSTQENHFTLFLFSKKNSTTSLVFLGNNITRYDVYNTRIAKRKLSLASFSLRPFLLFSYVIEFYFN